MLRVYAAHADADAALKGCDEVSSPILSVAQTEAIWLLLARRCAWNQSFNMFAATS
jgi:hypothetical protein